MSVKPILFNTEMVRAILDGVKTQTRRVVKEFAGEEILSVRAPDGIEIGKYGRDGWRGKLPDRHDGNTYCVEAKPPCKVGDILWVRETWNGDWCDHYIYKADGGSAVSAGYDKEPRWHPSIHMPRDAARIFLRVADVRVERLQEITPEQARAEGCDGRCNCPSSGGNGSLSCVERDFSVEKFESVWDSTIKRSDLPLYGWYANPWVWVIEFEQCEKPEVWH